jgi:hypothetical protein
MAGEHRQGQAVSAHDGPESKPCTSAQPRESAREIPAKKLPAVCARRHPRSQAT